MKTEIHVKKISPKSKADSLAMPSNLNIESVNPTSSGSAETILQAGSKSLLTGASSIASLRVGRRCAPVDGN